MKELTLDAISKIKREGLANLFQGYNYNYLPDAILGGYMDRVFVDNENDPQIAVLEATKIGLSIVGGNRGTHQPANILNISLRQKP